MDVYGSFGIMAYKQQQQQQLTWTHEPFSLSLNVKTVV